MIDPPWMPRTEEEYRQQLAEDVGPQPDEMVRLQQALDAAEHEIDRLNVELGARMVALDLQTEERDRLILAVKTLGGMEHFAQCPCCMADRTNGEWHSDDCPMVKD